MGETTTEMVMGGTTGSGSAISDGGRALIDSLVSDLKVFIEDFKHTTSIATDKKVNFIHSRTPPVLANLCSTGTQRQNIVLILVRACVKVESLSQV
jgi:hypothetical protein